MGMISFLGMGLLGSNFVRAMRARGEEVNVWNRSRDKAQALAETGARPVDDVAAAVRGAARVHVTLKDDAAVDDVLARAAPAAGTVIVDHTTVSPAGVAARVQHWEKRGITFVHAPVFMGPQNARESTGLMLVSGARTAVEPLRPELAKMTGKLVDLGEHVDRAAAIKLMGNLFLMAFTVGIADMFALGKQLGVSPADAAGLFEHFNPGVTIGARAKRMASGHYDEASWELAMARKDARLMAETGAPLVLTPAIAARMDELITQGLGEKDWTVMAKDSVS